MTTLLEAARDSERTYKESLLTTYEQHKEAFAQYIENYQNNPSQRFATIQNAPLIHENPILKDTKGVVADNPFTFETQNQFYLPKAEIQEFYDNGFIAKKYRFPHFSAQDIQRLESDYLAYQNSCYLGKKGPVYCKLPDYAGHLYMPRIIKLLHDNYTFIAQKSMSIFNKPEEELYFSVGTFIVDEAEKGENIHQDPTYYIFDQVEPEIQTSLITFHTAIANYKPSKFSLFPGTHKEILHTLNTLKYLIDHNILIDKELAMLSACVNDYTIQLRQLPYANAEVFLFSHIARYPQLVYILNKYKDHDITGYEVNTMPGEFVLFDPGLLHSNGASSGNIEELMASFDREVDTQNVSRLSLAIRVMHSKNKANHLLWMSAVEELTVLEDYLNAQCVKNKVNNIQLKKNTTQFNTVLCNNKISHPDSPYFSVSDMYHLHKQTGAYQTTSVSGKTHPMLQT